MPKGWHVGRKAIIDFFYKQGWLRSCSATAWASIRRWKRQGTIILRYDNNDRPFIIEEEISKSKLKQSEIIRKKKPI